MATSPKSDSPKSSRSSLLIAGLGTAATVLATLSLLLPAKAQFWGDWGGGRQRQQQQNQFGGWGWGDRGGWENRQYRDREYRDVGVEPGGCRERDAAQDVHVVLRAVGA